jgi:heme-degrading monooxygenase HmoA
MVELAMQQEGFLGVDSVRDDSKVGITTSYWEDLESIRKWHAVAEHQQAQAKGKSTWYKNFTIRICLIEREYEFES